MFHFKVHPAVDRILMFREDALYGEMQYVNTITDDSAENGETQTVKIFNANLEGETVIALILGSFGSTTMSCKQVFSKTLILKPADEEKDFTSNAVVVNWNKPKNPVDGENPKELPEPKICLLDFPESVTRPLSLPPTVIMQQFELPEEVKKEQAAQKGFDPNAEGYFIKQIYHKWPENEETIAALEEEKIKISLYQGMILKQVMPIPKSTE
jgi:hypothetical protein